MSFDRQAARALFNNPESRVPTTPDRTPRRTLQASPDPKAPDAKAARAVTVDAEDSTFAQSNLYDRLNRKQSKGPMAFVVPVVLVVGLAAGAAVLLIPKSRTETAAPAAITTTMPAPAPVAAVIPPPAPAEPAAKPAPALVAAAPTRPIATVRAARPATRAATPRPRASAPAETAPVNPPVTASAPSEPAPIVLPPPLPTPAPEPTAPQ